MVTTPVPAKPGRPWLFFLEVGDMAEEEPRGDHPGVVVTLNEIYSEMRSMRDEVRDMRAELRSGLNSVTDHEARIRALERKVWVAAGVAATFGGGAATFFGQILGM